MNLWNDINAIDEKVKSGELDMTGRLQLPKSGEAILFHLDLENKEGRNYLGFYITLEGKDDYRKFEVRCPVSADTDNSKYMAMQNIYNTLFGTLKADPKVIMVDVCFERLTKLLSTNSIKINYETEETKYIAQKGAKAGQEVSSVFLRKLSGISRIEKVGIEIKKKETNSSWNNESFTSEEAPF